MVGEFGWFAGDSLFGLVGFGRLFGGCCTVWFWVVGNLVVCGCGLPLSGFALWVLIW